MDEIIVRFMNALATHVMFIKNFFFYFEKIFADITLNRNFSAQPIFNWISLLFFKTAMLYIMILFDDRPHNRYGFLSLIQHLEQTDTIDQEQLISVKNKYQQFVQTNRTKIQACRAHLLIRGVPEMSGQDGEIIFLSAVTAYEIYIGLATLLQIERPAFRFLPPSSINDYVN
jgi:hypothetical protein